MKALVHTKPYVLEYSDVPDPVPGPQDVIVRVEQVGICGSDLHGYTGESGRRVPPIIMGHEAAGTVVSRGSEVPEVSQTVHGARVCFDSTVYCNKCPSCLDNRFNRCVDRQVLGVSVPGMKRQGAMAEMVQLPWWTLVEMPDSLSFRHAALIEPVSIAAHAVNIGEIRGGENVLVIGAGTIGLFVLQAARLKGAGCIMVSDLDHQRLALAKEFGADICLNPGEAELQKVVSHHFPDGGVDVAFEVVGVEVTTRQSVSATRIGGRIVLVGNLTRNVGLDVPEIISKELTLKGSYASSGEYRECAELVASGTISVEPLISETLPLSEGQAAFDRLRSGNENLLKIILKP